MITVTELEKEKQGKMTRKELKEFWDKTADEVIKKSKHELKDFA